MSNRTNKPKYCDWCKTQRSKLSCPNCQAVNFCSTTCRDEQAPFHQQHCHTLKQLRLEIVSSKEEQYRLEDKQKISYEKELKKFTEQVESTHLKTENYLSEIQKHLPKRPLHWYWIVLVIPVLIGLLYITYEVVHNDAVTKREFTLKEIRVFLKHQNIDFSDCLDRDCIESKFKLRNGQKLNVPAVLISVAIVLLSLWGTIWKTKISEWRAGSTFGNLFIPKMPRWRKSILCIPIAMLLFYATSWIPNMNSWLHGASHTPNSLLVNNYNDLIGKSVTIAVEELSCPSKVLKYDSNGAVIGHYCRATVADGSLVVLFPHNIKFKTSTTPLVLSGRLQSFPSDDIQMKEDYLGCSLFVHPPLSSSEWFGIVLVFLVLFYGIYSYVQMIGDWMFPYTSVAPLDTAVANLTKDLQAAYKIGNQIFTRDWIFQLPYGRQALVASRIIPHRTRFQGQEICIETDGQPFVKQITPEVWHVLDELQLLPSSCQGKPPAQLFSIQETDQVEEIKDKISKLEEDFQTVLGKHITRREHEEHTAYERFLALLAQPSPSRQEEQWAKDMALKLLSEGTVEPKPQGKFQFKCSICKESKPEEVYALGCGHTCCEKCQEDECSCDNFNQNAERTKLFIDWQNFAAEDHGRCIYHCNVCTQWRHSNQIVMYHCGHLTCVGCAMQTKKCSFCREEQTTDSVKLLHFEE